MEKFIDFITSYKLFISVGIILACFLLYCLFKSAILKSLAKKYNNKKRATYAKLFKNIIKYVLFLVCVVVILQINGVNVSSLIVGLGVVSAMAGLALQDALKDIINGFNIIMDNYFCVGDVVKIDNIEGKVIEFGLKSTKLQDIYTGDYFTIANRNIDRATIISNQLDINIPVPYEEKNDIMEKLIAKIIKKIKKDNQDYLQDIKYIGIISLDNSSINHRIRIWCDMDKKLVMKTSALKIIKELFDESKVDIPYQQIDIHNKK